MQFCNNSRTRCLLSSFKAIGPMIPEKKLFKGFYYLLAWLTCSAFDLDHLNLFLFPQPQKALHNICLQLAQWLLIRCLKFTYYESPTSKVKEWPRPLVLTHLHIFIYQFFGKYFETFHGILCSGIFPISDLAVNKVKDNPRSSF